MPGRPSLSCREFRRLHVEFVDGCLSHDDTALCVAHTSSCGHCAAHDVRIRRSLLALQALPTIQPSSDFRAKLTARITQEQANVRLGATTSASKPHRLRWVMASTAVAASIAVLLLGGIRSRDLAPARLAPVLARAPEPAVTPVPRAVPTAVTATRTPARFEALPGRVPLRTPSENRPGPMRIQTVNSIGQ